MTTRYHNNELQHKHGHHNNYLLRFSTFVLISLEYFNKGSILLSVKLLIQGLVKVNMLERHTI